MRYGMVTTTLALIALFGCTVAARQRLKHFFFEIPEAESADQSGASDGTLHAVPVEDRPALTLPPARFVSVHIPFESRDCQACHNADERMGVDSDQETTCGACHERYFGDEVGHGPVAGGDCLLCHDPHRSAFPGLLLTAVTENCAQCHEGPGDLSQPAHAGPEAARCTSCHDPHFGEPPLLKPGVKAPDPSSEK